MLFGKILLKKIKLEILKGLSSVDIKMNEIIIKVEVKDCEITFPEGAELIGGNSLEISLI